VPYAVDAAQQEGILRIMQTPNQVSGLSGGVPMA